MPVHHNIRRRAPPPRVERIQVTTPRPERIERPERPGPATRDIPRPEFFSGGAASVPGKKPSGRKTALGESYEDIERIIRDKGMRQGSRAATEVQIYNMYLGQGMSEARAYAKAREEAAKASSFAAGQGFYAGRGRSMQPGGFEQALALARGLRRSSRFAGYLYDPKDAAQRKREEEFTGRPDIPGEYGGGGPKRYEGDTTVMTGRQRRSKLSPGGVTLGAPGKRLG